MPPKRTRGMRCTAARWTCYLSRRSCDWIRSKNRPSTCAAREYVLCQWLSISSSPRKLTLSVAAQPHDLPGYPDRVLDLCSATHTASLSCQQHTIFRTYYYYFDHPSTCGGGVVLGVSPSVNREDDLLELEEQQQQHEDQQQQQQQQQQQKEREKENSSQHQRSAACRQFPPRY